MACATGAGALVSMLVSIPSFVSIAEKRRSMRACEEQPDGHRTLATRGNVRGTGACACECTVCMYMCIWWGARASRLSSRSKTIASASSCSGAATLLLAGVPAGSETPPPKAPLRTRLEGLLLALFRNSCEWRRCDWSSWALCRASSMMTPAGLLTRSHF